MLSPRAMTGRERDIMTETPPAAAPPSPIAGLGIVAIVVAAIVGWAILGSAIVDELSLFGGFLMLWHYANIEQLDIKRLPAALLGAVVGLVLAWQVVCLTQLYGSTGTIIGLLVMVVGIYLQMINILPMLFNASAMLFLTVAAAPLVQLKVNFINLGISTVVGGLFFAGFIEAVKWIATKLMTPAASAAQ